MQPSKASPNRKLCKREWKKRAGSSLRRAVNFTRKREHAFTRADNSPHRRLQWGGQDFLRFGWWRNQREYQRRPQTRRRQGVSEEEALKRGMEEKSKELVEKGAGVYSRT